MDGKKLDLLTSLSPFFPEKSKILPFFDAFFVGGNSDYVEMLMTTKNQKNKPQGSEDSDIDYNFVQYIIQTALKHRELDVTTRWSNLRFKIKEIHLLIENLLETPYVENEKEVKLDPINAEETGKYINYYNFISNITNNFNSRGKITLYEKICMEIFVSIWKNKKEAGNNMIKTTESLSSTLGDCVKKDNKICVRILDSIERKFTQNNSETIKKLGNLTNRQRRYMMSFFYNTITQLAIIMIKKLFNLQFLMDTPIDLTKFPPMVNDFESVLVELKPLFIEAISLSFQRVYEEQYKKGTLTSETRTGFRSELFPTINPLKIDNTPEVEAENRDKQAAYKLLKNNSVHNEFVNIVIKNWYNLNKTAMNFYLETISIFEEYDDGWSDNLLLDEIKMADLVKCLCSTNNRKIRVNLNKVTPEKTVFCNKLPLVNTKTSKKLWLTNAIAVPTSKDIIQQIYTQTLLSMDGIITISNFKYAIPKISHYNDPWDIDHVASMKFYLKPLYLREKKETVVETALDDNVIFDIETNEIWYNDGENLYKLDENGKKKIYNSSDYECSRGMGFSTNETTAKYCPTLTQCIITNPEKLPECLKNIGDEMEKNDKECVYDMFNTSSEEIQNMDPLIVNKMLEVFHVPLTKPMYDEARRVTIVRPVFFDNWVENILNSTYMPKGWTPEFKEILRNSEQLLAYIKGIINFAYNNPAIINLDKKIESESINTDENTDPQMAFLVKSGIHNFIEPYTLRSRLDIFGKQLDVYAMKFKQSPYNNSVMGGGDLSKILNKKNNNYDVMIMEGGNYGNNIGVFARTTFKDLETAGVKFTEKSKNKIEQTLKTLEKLEKKSYEMVQVLMLLRRALDHAKCYTGCNEEGSDIANLLSESELDLDSITNNRDFIKYLETSIGDYTTCINKMSSDIQNDNKSVITLLKNIINMANMKPVVIARKI